MIATTCPRVRLITVSRHDDGSFVQRLLDAGASGYVLKQSASTELMRGIRSVAAGERYLDRSVRRAPASSTAIPPTASTVRAELTVDADEDGAHAAVVGFSGGFEFEEQSDSG